MNWSRVFSIIALSSIFTISLFVILSNTRLKRRMWIMFSR